MVATQEMTLIEQKQCKCGQAFSKLSWNSVIVYRVPEKAFTVRYCPNCGQELAQLSTPAFVGDPRSKAERAADEWQAEYREDTRALYLGL